MHGKGSGFSDQSGGYLLDKDPQHDIGCPN